MRTQWGLFLGIVIPTTLFFVSSNQSAFSDDRENVIPCYDSTFSFNKKDGILKKCGNEECASLPKQTSLLDINTTIICLFVSKFAYSNNNQGIVSQYHQTERLAFKRHLHQLKNFPDCVHGYKVTICTCFTEYCNSWENIHEILKDQLANNWIKENDLFLNENVVKGCFNNLKLKELKKNENGEEVDENADDSRSRVIDLVTSLEENFLKHENTKTAALEENKATATRPLSYLLLLFLKLICCLYYESICFIYSIEYIALDRFITPHRT